MKNIIFLFTFLLTVSQVFSQTTTQDGDWITDATWGGSSPGFTGLTDIIVNHNVEATGDLIFSNANGNSLAINDTLIIYGDVIFNVTKNGASVTVGAGDVLIVFGNVELGKNNAGIDVATGGVVVVTGGITAVGNNGTISGSGTVYSPSTDLDDTGIGEGEVQPIDSLGGSGGDGFEEIEDFVTGGGSDPLPVELIYFNAQNDGNTILKWSTATEINNDHFVIERSEDGEYFYEIGKVQGNGNSNDVIDYSYHDNFPISKVEFYRLKQVDYNGDFEYFNAIRVETTAIIGKSEVMIYPNIVIDQYFNMKSNTAFELKEVILYNLKGGSVYHLMDNVEKVNPMSYRVDASHLEKGVYFINMTSTTGDTKSTRLIIK